MFLKKFRDSLAERLRELFIRIGYHSRPRFLIIGAQKAGTTALHVYLAAHPDIYPAREKEIGFFSPEVYEDWPEHPNHPVLCTGNMPDFFDRRTYPKKAAWYHSHFPLPHQIGQSGLTYEATPEYLYYPQVPARIFQYDPNMKLIAILRDPVERAFSAWKMYCDFGDYRPLIYAPHRETRQFEEAVRYELEEIRAGRPGRGPGYVRRGLYAEQLLRYFQFFDQNQILILERRALKDDPAGLVNLVIDFLGLPARPLPDEWPLIHVGHNKTQISGSTLRLLREFYQPYNESLYQLLDHDFGWQ